MMDLFERLFWGQFHPGVSTPSDREGYHKALQAAAAAQKALEAVLEDEQKKLLDEAICMRAEVTNQELSCVFSEGVRFGVELMAAIYPICGVAPVLPAPQGKKENG